MLKILKINFSLKLQQQIRTILDMLEFIIFILTTNFYDKKCALRSRSISLTNLLLQY